MALRLLKGRTAGVYSSSVTTQAEMPGLVSAVGGGEDGPAPSLLLGLTSESSQKSRLSRRQLGN